MLQHQLPIQ